MTSPQEDAALIEAYRSSRTPARSARAVPPVPVFPFEPLPPLDPETRRRARAVALQANDRYVRSFLEEHSICPFSRGGRIKGQTACFVHFAESTDAQPLIELMAQAAAQPDKGVVQVILPMVSVSADDFRDFCHAVTSAANARLPGGETYAVAPLHPELSYSTRNSHTLIPLFRRAPDPTIQWVRLDALESIYEGRGHKDIYVAPSELAAYLKKPHRQPLFEKIAETNQKMAHRLGLENIEQTLRGIQRGAQEGYRRALLGEEPAVGEPGHEEPGASSRPVHRPPLPPALEEGGRFALAQLHDLPLLSPIRFLVAGVELVAVRTKDGVHVLYGRCPHRAAPLDAALVEGDHLVCPYHGWDFRLADGRSDGVAGAAVHRFSAHVERGHVWVDADEVRRVGADVREVFSPDDVVL